MPYAGRLDELLEDPHYVVDVDPGRLVPHLNAARSAEARAVAAVYRQTAHQLPDLDGQMRASQLELTAHRSGYATVAASIATAVPDRPWQMRWSRGRRIVGHQILTGHTGPVTAVAVGQLPDGAAPRSSSAEEAGKTARYGCGGSMMAHRSGNRCMAITAASQR